MISALYHVFSQRAKGETINGISMRGSSKMRLVMAASMMISTGSFSQEIEFSPALKTLIGKALANSYQLENEKLDIRTTHLQRNEVREKYLPTIEAGGGHFFNKTYFNLAAPVSTLEALGLPPISSQKYNSSATIGLAGVTARMTLFSGLKIPYSARALTEKEKAQQAIIGKNEQEIVADVIATYDQLAVLYRWRQLLKESEVRLMTEKTYVEGALKNDLAIPYDLKKIEIAMINLESKKSELEGKQTLAMQKLAQLTHTDKETLAYNGEELIVWNVAVDNPTVDNRVELRAMDFSYRAAKYKMKSEQNWWMPKVQAVASYNYLNFSNIVINTPFYNPLLGANVSATIDRFEVTGALTAGVGFKWEIFDGLKGHQATQLAKIEMRKIENKKKETFELLNLNLQKTKVELQTAADLVELKSKQKDYATIMLNLAMKSYSQGLISITERLQEENAYEQSMLDHTQAVYSQRQAAINFLMATGDLMQLVNQQLPVK